MRDASVYCPVCGLPITSHEWDADSGVFVLCEDDDLDGYIIEED